MAEHEFTLERGHYGHWVMQVRGVDDCVVISPCLNRVDRWNVHLNSAHHKTGWRGEPWHRYDIEGFLTAQLAAIEMLTKK